MEVGKVGGRFLSFMHVRWLAAFRVGYFAII